MAQAPDWYPVSVYRRLSAHRESSVIHEVVIDGVESLALGCGAGRVTRARWSSRINAAPGFTAQPSQDFFWGREPVVALRPKAGPATIDDEGLGDVQTASPFAERLAVRGERHQKPLATTTGVIVQCGRMAMGKRTSTQEAMFVAATELPVAPGHPIHTPVPSLPPGRYVRLLLVGFFEGVDSEPGMAWRAADSRAASRAGAQPSLPTGAELEETLAG